MIKRIAITVVVLLAALLAFAATRPDSFRVERTTTIKAPPQKVFGLINDLHNWGGWSPWEKIDPGMKRTYSGAASGVGAAYEWDGNQNVGSGRMLITKSTAPTDVVIQLDFLKPFEAHNTAEFTLGSNGDSTNVTWSMSGQHTFISKLVCLFVSMDGMVGKDFENGLANLKALAEQ